MGDDWTVAEAVVLEVQCAVINESVARRQVGVLPAAVRRELIADVGGGGGDGEPGVIEPIVMCTLRVLVGAFMVLNTFSITVAQRTRENGLLRALRASRHQSLVAVLIEALVIGLLASAVGVVAGLGVAVGLKSLMSLVGIDIPTEGLGVSSSTILISPFIGVAIIVLAALSPARKAASCSSTTSAGASELIRHRPGCGGRRLSPAAVHRAFAD